MASPSFEMTRKRSIQRISTTVRRLGSVKRPSNVKIVLVGDGAVGKTHMVTMYTDGMPPPSYTPTLFDNYSKRVSIDARAVTLGLYDTAGQEDYDTLRPLSYPDTDVFILCFSIIRKSSMVNIKQKWVKEIRKHHPNTPMILCGTKIDLRDDEDFVEDKDYKSRHCQITFVGARSKRNAIQQLEDCLEAMSYSKTKAVRCILQNWFRHNALSAAFIDELGLVSLLEERIDDDIGLQPRFIAMNRSFGECLAAEIGAVEYVECSGITGEGMEFAFEQASIVGLERAEYKAQQKGCCSCKCNCVVL